MTLDFVIYNEGKVKYRRGYFDSTVSEALNAANYSVTLNEVELSKEDGIKFLQKEKAKLLDKHGVFGGGEDVNAQHRLINKQLEILGVSE